MLLFHIEVCQLLFWKVWIFLECVRLFSKYFVGISDLFFFIPDLDQILSNQPVRSCAFQFFWQQCLFLVSIIFYTYNDIVQGIEVAFELHDELHFLSWQDNWEEDLKQNFFHYPLNSIVQSTTYKLIMWLPFAI